MLQSARLKLRRSLIVRNFNLKKMETLASSKITLSKTITVDQNISGLSLPQNNLWQCLSMAFKTLRPVLGPRKS